VEHTDRFDNQIQPWQEHSQFQASLQPGILLVTSSVRYQVEGTSLTIHQLGPVHSLRNFSIQSVRRHHKINTGSYRRASDTHYEWAVYLWHNAIYSARKLQRFQLPFTV
jgi:hypothetical protein